LEALPLTIPLPIAEHLHLSQHSHLPPQAHFSAHLHLGQHAHFPPQLHLSAAAEAHLQAVPFLQPQGHLQVPAPPFLQVQVPPLVHLQVAPLLLVATLAHLHWAQQVPLQVQAPPFEHVHLLQQEHFPWHVQAPGVFPAEQVDALLHFPVHGSEKTWVDEKIKRAETKSTIKTRYPFFISLSPLLLVVFNILSIA
jgi:hypothetical protein